MILHLYPVCTSGERVSGRSVHILPADLTLPSNLQLAGWTHTTTHYGPAWTYLSTGWSYVAGDDIAVNVIVFRVFLFAACLANAVLIWKLLGRVDPSYRLPGLIFYAWNPIVVLKGMGRVETVMLFSCCSVCICTCASGRGGRAFAGRLGAHQVCHCAPAGRLPHLPVEAHASPKRNSRTVELVAVVTFLSICLCGTHGISRHCW